MCLYDRSRRTDGRDLSEEDKIAKTVRQHREPCQAEISELVRAHLDSLLPPSSTHPRATPSCSFAMMAVRSTQHQPCLSLTRRRTYSNPQYRSKIGRGESPSPAERPLAGHSATSHLAHLALDTHLPPSDHDPPTPKLNTLPARRPTGTETPPGRADWSQARCSPNSRPRDRSS